MLFCTRPNRSPERFSRLTANPPPELKSPLSHARATPQLRSAEANFRDVVVTDSAGRFTIHPSAEIGLIVALGPQGFAESTVEELQNVPALTLKPWGRVEGRLLQGGQPVPGEEVVLSPSERGAHKLRLDFSTFQMKTGPNGEFAVDWVPPRSLTLARLVPIDRRTRQHAILTNFVAMPGETTRLEVQLTPAE
jgi:hypothetical protein